MATILLCIGLMDWGVGHSTTIVRTGSGGGGGGGLPGGDLAAEIDSYINFTKFSGKLENLSIENFFKLY